jgi:hypothetical protein
MLNIEMMHVYLFLLSRLSFDTLYSFVLFAPYKSIWYLVPLGDKWTNLQLGIEENAVNASSNGGSIA